MVVQQVDLVDVKQAAVGRGQHARLEVALAALDRLLDVQRADHPVLGGADRQIDKAGAAVRDRQQLAARQALPALIAEGVDAVGSQPKRQSATTAISGSRSARARAAVDLAVPRFAADQHAADLRM